MLRCSQDTIQNRIFDFVFRGVGLQSYQPAETRESLHRNPARASVCLE